MISWNVLFNSLCALLFFLLTFFFLTLKPVLLVQRIITDFTFHLLTQLCQPDKIWTCLLLFHLAHPLPNSVCGYVFTSRALEKASFPCLRNETKIGKDWVSSVLKQFWPLYICSTQPYCLRAKIEKSCCACGTDLEWMIDRGYLALNL